MDNIRPIRTQEDYEWAIAEITRYFENEPEPGTSDGDRFDVLADLIEAYEDKHYPIEVLDPISTISAHMEMTGRKRSDLAKILGSKPRASEILNRRRALTMEMAYKLHKEWRIPAEALIKPYHLVHDEERRQTPKP